MKKILSIVGLLLLAAACTNTNNKGEKENTPGIQKEKWGNVDNKEVYLYTLRNANGTTVKITNYGGTITSFTTKDKNGRRSDIVIGFDSLGGYLQKPPYFGALIGRYGNRIAKAKFTLDGKEYKLAANNGVNSLHGGVKGFDKVVWDAATTADSVPTLILTYLSKDGEEGYPGNLKVTVTYSLINDDALKIEYSATTDKATPLNLTNHAYFNLTGSTANTILGHSLFIDADNYTPVDTTLIPTGEIKSVKGTYFDFTKEKLIGKDIDSVKGGFDHNFVLNNKTGSLQKVAVLSDNVSGRSLEVYTTQPGLQFYSGNFLDGKFINRDGKPVNLHTALCLETQHFPDSPNQPAFPSTILEPGKQYHETTIYKVVLH